MFVVVSIILKSKSFTNLEVVLFCKSLSVVNGTAAGSIQEIVAFRGSPALAVMVLVNFTAEVKVFISK